MSEVAPSREAIASTGRRVKLVAVAQTQRILITLVLVTIAIQAGAIALPDLMTRQSSLRETVNVVLGLAYVLCGVAAIVFTVRLAIISGANKVIAIIAALFMIVPCLGLLLLLRANMMATKVLRDNGAKVGFLGVSPSEFNRLRQNSCTGCGYSIEGIATGVCPECGANLAAASSTVAPPTLPGRLR